MSIEPRLDIIGAALADPSRARILCELMDGRAFTNKELACAAGIAPPTASGHLRKLQDAGLVTALRSGRHVYFRIASETVASVLERLASLSPTDHLTRHSKAACETRAARSCYNHIAGQLGVALAHSLVRLGLAELTTDGVRALPGLNSFSDGLGLEWRGNGPPLKLCLDWTERRHHLSGPFATALMTHALDQGWLSRRVGSRALTITEVGQQAFAHHFGLTFRPSPNSRLMPNT